MGLEQEIGEVRAGIKAGRFANEAAVSQGVVLRLLNALGWPAYDTQTVSPEYALEGRRVDYALCHPPGKPIAFIEVKNIGQSDGAERQLFEYAFYKGVQLAILTDGQEWNFFLPAEQGDFSERRVYKLDIVERDINECVLRLNRYLKYDAVLSGTAIEAAREDYRDVSRERQIKSALPQAWAQLVEDEDELLLELVADRVESLCGYKPDPDTVATFIKTFKTNATPEPTDDITDQPITSAARGMHDGQLDLGQGARLEVGEKVYLFLSEDQKRSEAPAGIAEVRSDGLYLFGEKIKPSKGSMIQPAMKIVQEKMNHRNQKGELISLNAWRQWHVKRSGRFVPLLDLKDPNQARTRGKTVR